MRYIIGQNVMVDGVKGFISAVYPEGKGQYHGQMHAYYWVCTPSLDYTDDEGRFIMAGRAVPFEDAERRLKPCNK